VSVRRIYVTGTDTDVGKTRVTAAVARGLAARGDVTVVKLVQTGLPPNVPGDAAEAARLAGCPFAEFARFAEPADPWNAALAERLEPPTRDALVAATVALRGDVVLEGAGGAAVPLNAAATLTDVAADLGAEAVVVVALRLGCISHARLTLEYLSRRGVPVRALALTERHGPTTAAYRAQVTRALAANTLPMVLVPYDDDAARSVARAAADLAAFL
jgi:dethiobiotin synthetase